MQDSLRQALEDAAVSPQSIERVLESGYLIRGWYNPFSGRTWTTVSDMMYGNKQFSSSFPIDQFIAYLEGRFQFPSLPALRRLNARNMADIAQILAEPCRAHYLAEGTLSFRGQPREYKFKRPVPNPVRADENGNETSIMPGIFRQGGDSYSFNIPPIKKRSIIRHMMRWLEPNSVDEPGSLYPYDLMRTEQHYSSQTSGLDLTFDIGSAVFFATHRFQWDPHQLAFYEPVAAGDHKGVIYCFRFREPPVKQTQYLIKEFDLFKTYPPERILRQESALPLFHAYERNIALTDIDCIIELAPDFAAETNLSPEYMFPSVLEDAFYAKLLSLKDKHPDSLADVVEYRWARKTV
jgi:hypothetical protein